MKHISVLLVSLAVLFSACGSDTPESKPATADVTYQLSGGADMVSLFNITITYTTETGAQKQETVTALPWSKSIHVGKLPFTAKMTTTLSGKTAYPEKVQYKVGLGGGISYITSDGRGESSVNSDASTITAAQLPNYIQTHSKAFPYETVISD
jgi:outer membrane lipoprotein-sorting protein